MCCGREDGSVLPTVDILLLPALATAWVSPGKLCVPCVAAAEHGAAGSEDAHAAVCLGAPLMVPCCVSRVLCMPPQVT